MLGGHKIIINTGPTQIMNMTSIVDPYYANPYNPLHTICILVNIKKAFVNKYQNSWCLIPVFVVGEGWVTMHHSLNRNGNWENKKRKSYHSALSNIAIFFTFNESRRFIFIIEAIDFSLIAVIFTSCQLINVILFYLFFYFSDHQVTRC